MSNGKVPRVMAIYFLCKVFDVRQANIFYLTHSLDAAKDNEEEKISP
jgi:hypothetical protein